jgi:hypothetical protein
MRVELDIDEVGADGERLDELTTAVGRDLRDLPVQTVERSGAGSAPVGARGDALAIAGLIITLADSRVLASVVHTLRSWVAGPVPVSRSIRIRVDDDELTITSTTLDQDADLIAAWLRRHAKAVSDA